MCVTVCHVTLELTGQGHYGMGYSHPQWWIQKFLMGGDSQAGSQQSDGRRREGAKRSCGVRPGGGRPSQKGRPGVLPPGKF